MCPTVGIEPSVQSFITHYSAHPRILPNLQGIDWTSNIMAQSTLRGYKLAKIKRAPEMAVIFDATVNNPSGAGQWIAFAEAYALNSSKPNIGTDSKPYLTDDYSLAPTQDASQPIGLDARSSAGVWGTPDKINTDGDLNTGNIRFRHSKDTQTNALMLDGHVQSFSYNKNTKTTDMLRKNIYVNQ